MKKVYRIKGLDCANCAAKLEREICKIDGVANVAVNFLSEKITIEGADLSFVDIENKMIAVAKKIEPDCVIEAR